MAKTWRRGVVVESVVGPALTEAERHRAGLVRRRMWSRAEYWRRKEAGLCVIFGCEAVPVVGRVQCEEHRLHANAQARLRDRRKEGRR